MFKKLAKSGFAKFWPAEPRRIAQGLHEVGLFDDTYANDNLPGFRRPAAAGKRRSPAPALTCHWLERNGRLERRWQAERSGDKTIGDLTSAVRRADRDRTAGCCTPVTEQCQRIRTSLTLLAIANDLQ